MGILQVSYIICIIVNAFFSFFLILNVRKVKKAKSLLAVSLLSFLWMMLDALGLFVNFSNNDINLFILKVSLSFIIILPIAILYFISSFVSIKIPKSFTYFLVVIIYTAIIITLMTNLVIKDVKIDNNWNLEQEYGLFAIPILIMIISILAGVFILLMKYLIKNKHESNYRNQIITVMLAFSLPIFLGFSTNMILPILGINFPRIAHILALVTILTLIFAIYKYEAFNLSLSNFRVREKMLLGFIPLIVISVLVQTIFAYITIKSIYIKSEGQKLEGIAHIQFERLNLVIDRYLENHSLISTRTQMRSSLADYNVNKQDTDLDFLNRAVEDSLNSVHYFDSISILDKTGKVIATTDIFLEGKDLSQSKLFVNGKIKQEISYTNENIINNNYQLFIYGPIIEKDEVVGVLLIVTNIKDIDGLFEDYESLGETGEVTVAHRKSDNTLMYYHKRRFENSSSIRDVITMNDTEVPSVQALLGNEKLFLDSVDYRNKRVMAYTQKINELDWGMVVKIDLNEIYSPLNQFLVMLALIDFFVVIVSVSALFLISNSITKSITKLSFGIEEIEKGNLDYKVGISSNDEIGIVAKSFDNMTIALKKSKSEIDKRVDEQTRDIRDKEGELEQRNKVLVSIMQDIEKEKRLTAIEKDKLNLTIQSIGDAVFVVDSDMRISHFNDVAAELSGYDKKDAIGKDFREVLKFVHEKDLKENYSFITNALELGSVQEMKGNTLLIRSDKSSIMVSDSAAPIKDQKGKTIGCVVVFRDVTKEKEIDKMKTEFVSLASHQLKTPLSAIRWILEIIQAGDAGKLSPELKGLIGKAWYSTLRMVDLVNSLLNVSRIETGQLAVKPVKTDLVKLAKETSDELSKQVQEKKLKFQFIVPVKKEISVVTDPKLLREVLSNVLSNAIKYTPEKGDVRFDIKESRETIVFTIQDTGIGIPQAQKKMLFKKFFRADNAQEMNAEGNGLGLYLVKSIVDLLKGSIEIESEENAGTTVYIKISSKDLKPNRGTKELA